MSFRSDDERKLLREFIEWLAEQGSLADTEAKLRELLVAEFMKGREIK